MNRIYRTPGRSGGFSLIEVMIAVVVLATGLLALAALQGSLTRSSAEAKVRSRVAALLSARMDELRAEQYDGAVSLANADGCDVDLGADDFVPASFCAETGMAPNALRVAQEVRIWSSPTTAAAFTEGRNPTVGAGEPEFKRVVLQATWQDSGSDPRPRVLAVTSDLSALALRDSLLPPPAASGTASGTPVVRTDNPAGPGVIPIAVGGGDATAASNPRPELVGKNNNTTVTGTRFDVLTYNGLTGAAVIQRRVETAVIKCECRLGAGGNNLPEIYRKSEWPAVWTGERYDLYVPTPKTTAAPGQGKNSGPKPNVDQSPLCQECCRDHFDGNSTSVARFDPERADSHNHFLVDGAGKLVAQSATDTDYVEACRVLRVDGFWRTAADMYSRQYGLLATETVNGKEAATGVPDSSATASYQTFVKDYLVQYDGNTATAPAGAQAKFDESARNLNAPQDVDIATPSSSDYRYLHGRGLYVDYLEPKALAKIKAVLADTGANGECPTGSDKAECILPYLPFTTVNVTELVRWKAVDANIISVNSGNLLGANPSQPSGGRTIGVKKGATDNGSRINMSNFGLAASSDALFNTIEGVDTVDAATVGTDKQLFDVGGDNSPPSSGDQFNVRVSGLTTQDPDVFYSVGTSGECFRPDAASDYRCSTNTNGISGGTVTVSQYWREYNTLVRNHTTTVCVDNQGNPKNATADVNFPTFANYEVAFARIGSVSGSYPVSGTPDGKKTEATSITFGPELIDGALVEVGFREQGTPTKATIKSCTTNGGGNQINNIVWDKPWENP